MKADALIVGAGIVGAATALALQEAGMRCLLVDRHRPAWGASGRNPGVLWLQTKAAGTAMRFSLAAREFAESFASDYPEACFRASGGLIAWRDPEFDQVAAAFVRDRRAAGLEVELLDRPALAAVCPHLGPEVRGGVWNDRDAHQDTAGLVAAIVARFEDRGGRFCEASSVLDLIMTTDRCGGAILEDGTRIEAGLTVLAAGFDSLIIAAAAGLKLPLTPMRFEAAATEPAPFLIEPVFCGQAIFRFFTPPGLEQAALPRETVEQRCPGLGFTEQVATRYDGALLFGCAYEVGSNDDRPTVGGQAMALSILARDFPGMASLALDATWAGIVAATPDSLPVIDADPGVPGLALNCGHFFGNLAGTFSARLLADMLTGRDPAFPMEDFGLAARQNTCGDALE